MHNLSLFIQNMVPVITDTINQSASHTATLIANQIGNVGSNHASTSVAVITKITYQLFLFLVLAIFVERSVEIFMSALKYTDLKRGWYKIWNLKAARYQQRLDKIVDFQGAGQDDKKLLYRWIFWNIVSDKPYSGGKDIIAAKSIRTNYYRVISRLFAFALALVFSIFVYTYLKIDLVSILYALGEYNQKLPDWGLAKILITAVLLAIGSEPLHQVISRFEKIGQSKKI